MNKIRDMTTEELQYGIYRCDARLSGIMPMGLMTVERCQLAKKEYRRELEKRDIKVLMFDL